MSVCNRELLIVTDRAVSRCKNLIDAVNYLHPNSQMYLLDNETGYGGNTISPTSNVVCFNHYTIKLVRVRKVCADYLKR